MEMPADYRAWLRIADGQERGGLTVFPLCAWLTPLDEVLAYRKAELTADGRDDARTPCVLHPTVPDADRYYCRLPRRERLGVAQYEEQESSPACALGLKGTSQIIAAVDDQHFIVLGQSLATYFERIARLLERRALVPLVFDSNGSEILATPKGETGRGLLTEEPEP